LQNEGRIHFTKNLPIEWLKLAARMYQAACNAQSRTNSGGIVVLSTTVLVDGKGQIIQYTAPKCEALEPKHDSERLLRLLTQKE